MYARKYWNLQHFIIYIQHKKWTRNVLVRVLIFFIWNEYIHSLCFGILTWGLMSWSLKMPSILLNVPTSRELYVKKFQSPNFFFVKLCWYSLLQIDILTTIDMQRSAISLLIFLSRNCRLVNMANWTAKRLMSVPF